MSSVMAGLAPELLRAAGVVFLLGLWLSSRDLPLGWAATIAAAKVAVPLAYFALDPAGLLHVSDGLDYYHDALELLRQGYGPAALFRDPAAQLQFREAAGGLHVAYPFWNLVALSALGPYYFAPVFLNVGLAFGAGWLFARLLRLAGEGIAYRRLALTFFLLHPDILAWSSFLNLKDSWVAALSLVALYLAASMPSARAAGSRFGPAWRIPALIAVLVLLAFFRFYAPLLLLAALSSWWLLEGTGKGRFLLPALGLSLAVALAARFGGTAAWISAGAPEAMALPFGIVRFLATPLPWRLSPDYAFLFLPSLWHVLLLVPALLAVPWLWRSSPAARLALLYLAIVILFYAVTPSLQGPRQRLQAGFAFAWLQFHALWTLGRYAVRGGEGRGLPDSR